MATVLGSLLVSLGLESAEFDRGLDKAKKGMRRAAKDIDKESDRIYQAGYKIGSGLRSLANTAVVAAGFEILKGKIEAAVTGSLELASSLGETAAQLGVTTDALQEYRYAATQAGLSQEEMDQALSQLTRRIGEAANGTKTQAQAFKSLGVSVKDANGNVLSASEAIPKIADALQGVQNPAQRAAVLMDLFGKSGQKLEPLLSGGSAAVNELRDAAHKLGIVLSEEQIQKADDTADKLAALNTVLDQKIAATVADNADAILALANAFAKLVDWIGQAAGAYRRFKLEQGLRLNENAANGWLTSDAQKAEARKNADRFRYELAKMDGKVDTKGAFRDYRLDPMPTATSTTAASAASMGAGASARSSRGGGRSAADIAKEAARNAAQFNAELKRIQVDQLQAEAEYSGNLKQGYEAKIAAINADLAAYVESVRIDEDLTTTQKQALIAAKTGLAEQEKANAEQEYSRDQITKKAEIDRATLQIQLDDAQIRADLADNSRDRRDAELAILALQDRLRIAELDRILAVEATASAAWQNAKAEKDALIASQGARENVVRRGTMSPGEAYMASLPQSVNQINDAIEGIKVDGLRALEDGLVNSIVQFKSLGDVARNVISQILSDLLRLQIQKSIIGPLSAALGLGGGGGPTNLLAGIPGYASGTKFHPGGLAIVGEKGPELINLNRGASVVPNHELPGMMGNGGATFNNSFVIQAPNEKAGREAAGAVARRLKTQMNGPTRGY